jgi:hypothetical protein
MRRLLLLASVGGAVVVTAGWLAACGELPETRAVPKAVTVKDVEAMMKKVHAGKDAPLARTRAELKKDAPNWEVLAKDAKAFTEMGGLMRRAYPMTYTARSPYWYAVEYAERGEALVKAAKGNDRPAATAAFAGLSKSCSACHYGYPARLESK